MIVRPGASPPNGGLTVRLEAGQTVDIDGSFVLSSVRLGRTTTLPTSGYGKLRQRRLRRQRQRHWACWGRNSRRLHRGTVTLFSSKSKSNMAGETVVWSVELLVRGLSRYGVACGYAACRIADGTEAATASMRRRQRQRRRGRQALCADLWGWFGACICGGGRWWIGLWGLYGREYLWKPVTSLYGIKVSVVWVWLVRMACDRRDLQEAGCAHQQAGQDR